MIESVFKAFARFIQMGIAVLVLCWVAWLISAATVFFIERDIDSVGRALFEGNSYTAWFWSYIP